MAKDDPAQPNLWVRVQALFEKATGTLDTLNGSVTGLVNLLENPNTDPIPRMVNAVKAANAAAPTYSFLDMGGPRGGLYWDVRRYAVYGSDPFATITGTVIAFVADGTGAFADTSTEPSGFPNVIGPSGTIPNGANWDQQIRLIYPQHLVFVLKGLANNVQVYGSMEVNEYTVLRKLAMIESEPK